VCASGGSAQRRRSSQVRDQRNAQQVIVGARRTEITRRLSRNASPGDSRFCLFSMVWVWMVSSVFNVVAENELEKYGRDYDKMPKL
jgi:hypothetical protein